MTRTVTLFGLWCLLAATLVYGAGIPLFQAAFDGPNVRVEWEASNETGVQSYDIWRKANNESTFARLATVPASSQRRYLFLDTNMYRGTASAGPFTYRLTVRSTTGDQQYTTVRSTPNAVQRSWGSIKSMFR